MSKADTLGSAPAFGAARGARSSRRNLIDQTIAGEASAAAAITELPVTLISDNPDNPRNHLRNLDETVQSVREVGIPIAVATVDAYMRNRSDRADDLDKGAQYIVVETAGSGPAPDPAYKGDATLRALWADREDKGHPPASRIGRVLYWGVEEWERWFTAYQRQRNGVDYSGSPDEELPRPTRPGSSGST